MGSTSYRAPEALTLFVSHIEYRQSMPVSEASPLNGYPCAMALAKVGHNSVPVILAHLQSIRVEDISDRAVELYADVLISVYYSDPGGPLEAVDVVRRRVERVARDRKTNLNRLLVRLENLTRR